MLKQFSSQILQMRVIVKRIKAQNEGRDCYGIESGG